AGLARRASWRGGGSPPVARVLRAESCPLPRVVDDPSRWRSTRTRRNTRRTRGAAPPRPACPSGQASLAPLAGLKPGGSPVGLARPTAAVRLGPRTLVQVGTGPVNIPAMELTFIGLSCLRLRGRDTEGPVDPVPQGA